MSDARARELERTLAASGTVEAEARLLAERLRGGAVTWDEVAFDAYLGAPAAQLALGEPVEPVRFGDLYEAGLWLRGLGAWGPEAVARGVVAWHRTCALRTVRRRSAPVESVLAAIDAWCVDPNAATTNEIDVASRRDLDQPLRDLAFSVLMVSAAFARNEVLRAVDDALRLHEGPLPEPHQVAIDVRRWGPAPGLALELAPGPLLLSRVVDTTTPPERRRLVHAARANEERAVVLVWKKGRPRRVDGIEEAWFESFLTNMGAMCRVGYDALSDIHPG